MKDLVLLGATGSIGRQALDILKYSYEYDLVGLTFSSNYNKIEEYLLYFPNLKYVGIIDENAGKEFQNKYKNYKVIIGKDANIKILELNKESVVLNSILGNDGLVPTLVALKQNQVLLLSNKESLVIGSYLVNPIRKKSKSKIYPIDSEHVGLYKLLNQIKEEKRNKKDIESYVITASGGALRDKEKRDLKNVKPEEVLSHPTWNMGNKITIDSATLINKAYEVIEASVLFNIPIKKIKPLICRSSLIHASIIFKDKSQIFELSPVDMKVAISFALSFGKTKAHKINFDEEKMLKENTLEEIDFSFYPCFKLTLNMYKKFGNVGMIFFNALDTKLIDEFIANNIPFTDIYLGLKYLYLNFNIKEELTEENIDKISTDAIKYANKIIANKEYKK